MHGFQAENTSRAVIVICRSTLCTVWCVIHTLSVWRSFQDYTNWTTQQDYSSFISSLPISLANSLEIQMVDFKVDPSEAFSCPITEIATMKFQEGSTKQQMDAVFHSFMNLRPKISRELDQSGDNYPKYFAWGEVEGVPYTYCFSLGWDSLEVRTTISEARQTSVVKTILENGELIPNYFTAPQKDWETVRSGSRETR